MKLETLISITSCVLLAVKCEENGKDFPEGQNRPGCVQSCRMGEQEEFGDHCYFWSKVHERKNWEESKSHCEGLNGTLAAVTSLPIHNFLMKKVDKAL